MNPIWDDVIARVRGLSSRLLGRAALERLAMARDVGAFIKDLEASAYAAAAGAPRALEAERQMRRSAGDRLTIIADWCGDRAELLAPLFEDEDRRNLRALVRGVVAHAPAEESVAGLLPTPALSFASLQALAGETRVSDIAAALTAWGNPYGAAMLPEATRANPDLFALQFAIDREYACRAVRIAAHTGGPMVAFVQTIIDTENARAALAVAARSLEHADGALFMRGGEIITASVFRDVCALPIGDARMRLTHLLGGTVLAPVVAGGADDGEGAALTAMLRHLRRVARRDPRTLVVVIEYVLALRAELQDLARIVWGIGLHVPRRRIASRLVTP